MFIAWTTVANEADARRLATGAVELGVAACSQVEGPLTSVYRWKGQLQQAREFRITFKVAGQADALEAFVLKEHPYKVPEWIILKADRVSEKYLSWAKGVGRP
jgi:periplasmic divalent cation tolerance protein